MFALYVVAQYAWHRSPHPAGVLRPSGRFSNFSLNVSLSRLLGKVIFPPDSAFSFIFTYFFLKKTPQIHVGVSEERGLVEKGFQFLDSLMKEAMRLTCCSPP